MSDAIFEQPTTDEQPFVDAICAQPADRAPRRIFADWLDERGDPRGEWLRASLEIEEAIESLGWGFAFRMWRPLARKLLERDDRARAAFETCDACETPGWKDLPDLVRQATTGHWYCGGFVENVAIGRQGLETFGDELRRSIPLRGVSSMSGSAHGPEELRRGGSAIWRGIERIVDYAHGPNQGFAPFTSLVRAQEFAALTDGVRALATGPYLKAEALAAFLGAKPIESLFLELPRDNASEALERLLDKWRPTNLRCLALVGLVIEGRPIASLADWPGLAELRLLHLPHLSLGRRSRRLVARSRHRHPNLCVFYPFLSDDEKSGEEGVAWIDSDEPKRTSTGRFVSLSGRSFAIHT